MACLLSAVTIYSSSPITLNTLLLFPATVVYLMHVSDKHTKQPSKPTLQKKTEDEKPDPLPVRPFITAYRGGMMTMTCIAILAVDFRIFPRRFAKVETWGTSLMDMGVGSFVFSAGLVAARPTIKSRQSGTPTSVTRLVLASPRASIPLLVLGFIRLYSVKGLDYAEHVTEYGVHWNFFFTLALIPPFASLFQPMLTTFSTYFLTMIIGFIYELLLEKTELKSYILTSPRIDLLSQNREGVCSFPGYLLIFLIGQGLGLQILPRSTEYGTVKPPKQSQRWLMFYHLLGNSVFWTLLLAFCLSLKYGPNLEVSRRLANVPYVCWVAAFNCSQLLMFYTVEQLCFPEVLSAKDRSIEQRETSRATSRILKSFNRNGLPIFLLANLLTGLVNLSVDTLSMSRLGSLGILLAYCLGLTAVAVTLDSYHISIKF